jgi:hypothetical protein
MADDAWLVQKQAEYLKQVIAFREVSIELLDCLSALTKAVISQIGKDALRHDNIGHLANRARELMEQSDQMTGLIVGPSPNEMLQQELGGLPNVDVTLPGVR